MNYFKLLIFTVALYIYTNVSGQFSFIPIQDTIVLTDSNCIIFHSQDIDTSNYYCMSYLKGSKLTIVDSIYENMSAISHAIDKENRNRNIETEKKVGKYILIQQEPFYKYAFQIYTVKNQYGKLFYLTIILKKSYYVDWKVKPIFINDGCNNYYIYGLVPI